ncbi:MAG: hypothetical protein K6T74_15300 [Geminicoccaceae bacterium]|nr:hypothetical protein [Geminicoccaceae bacterium]
MRRRANPGDASDGRWAAILHVLRAGRACRLSLHGSPPWRTVQGYP